MPLLEPTVLPQDRYSLRLVGPKALVWPQSPATPVVVLARTDMIARVLPSSPLPSSPDLVTGTFTNRLNDSGEASFTFPNSVSSDGVPWRARFDPTGHLQFVEVYDNGELDFVGVIDQVPTVDEGQVQVHVSDPWWLLKKAYVRDWTVVQAPRDVMDRGTQVWVPTTVDDFPAGSLSPQWTVSGTGTAVIGPSGGCVLTDPTSDAVAISSQPIPVTATGVWRAGVDVQAAPGLTTQSALVVAVTESDGSNWNVQIFSGYAILAHSTGGQVQVQLPAAISYGLSIESDGEWVSGYVNGRLIGQMMRRTTPTTTSLKVSVSLSMFAGQAGSVVVGSALVEALQPFLQRGSDKGDYVLPGNASTYPNGGLHARYYNDLDLQSDASRALKVMAPTRSQAYAGSGPAEYVNQQDAQINAQVNPTPGAATSNWSAKWFGAIYLKLSGGNYTFQWNNPSSVTSGTAVRIWIGKTKLGDQLVDQWTFASGAATYSFTVSAAALAGALPYGGGSVQRDGWYPIKVEYAVDSTAHGAGALFITNSPAAYTDPGGTAIASGGQATVVPATSLSPLGCVDQRYQGISHFDLVQQTGQGYGHQLSTEPKQLESGQFPGVLAPRIREGHDTDIVLQPDIGPRQDGEGLLNYSSGLDATDFCASLFGNGAGLQNGTSGQLQSLVYDAPTLETSLFDVQGWQDFSDASFSPLLQALLNSQLGLRLSPWQILSADPKGSPRLSYSWPLPGALAAMRWRPGDGLRIQAREINVWDVTPRQMLVITRTILPLGIASTTATFAERPRTPAKALKQALFSATRWQRNYQRQLVTIPGSFQQGISVAALASTSVFSMLSLSPADTLVRARLRIMNNTGAVSLNVLINGVDLTSTLNGPWTTVPLNIDIGAVAASSSDSRLYVQIKNNSSTTATELDFQLLADVLR